MTTRCAIYCRVSSDEQVKNLSLETQRNACERYAQSQGWEVAAVFVEEGESAKTANRTEFQKLLTYCRSQKGRVHFVVVYDLSRFMRNTQEHLVMRATLAGIGIQLRSPTQALDESPGGRLVETLLAAVYQHQNDEKSERTVVGMKAALEKGRWTHCAPLGYRNTRDADERPTMALDESRAPLIRQAFEMAAAGASQREILRAMHARGLKARMGGPITAQTLEGLLRNPIYSGRVRSKAWGVEARGAFPALVPEDLYLAAQAALGRKHPAESHKRKRDEFPLKHFVRCATDGRPLTGYFAKGKTTRVPYYECPACRDRARREKLEADFLELLSDLRPEKRLVEDWKAEVIEALKQQQREAEDAADALRRRSNDLGAKRERFLDLLAEGAIDGKTYQEAVAKVEADRALVELDLKGAQDKRVDVIRVISRCCEVMTSAGAIWEASNLEQRMALQGFLFPEGLKWTRATGFVRTRVSLFAFASYVPKEVVDSVWRPSGHGLRTWPPAWLLRADVLTSNLPRVA